MATDCPDHKDIFIHLLGDSARKKQVPPSVLESTPGYICGAANLASCFPSKGGLSFHNKEHDISVPRVEKKAGASAELSEEVTAAPLGRNLSARNSGIGQDSNKNLVFKEGMAGPQCCSVLVTGANRGIGLELVSQLLRKTNPPKVVFATCRDPEGAKGQELRNMASKHSNLKILQLEATDPASVEAAAKKAEAHLGGCGLNLLINNAGIMPACSMESVNAKDMLDVYNTNVVGPLLVVKAFLPLLKKAAHASQQKGLNCGKAAIVNMSTVLGSIEKTPETYFFMPVVSYRCSKAALNMLTKMQSMGYKEDGILCTAIHPGWVKTDLGTDQADLTVEESVSGIMNVLCSLSEKQHGVLLTWEGKTLPW